MAEFRHNGIDRTIRWAVPATALAWLIRVSVSVDYQQVFIYPTLFAASAAVIVALWRARRPWIKLPLLAAFVALSFLVGLASVIQAGHERRFSVISTQLLLDEAATEYSALLGSGGGLQVCDTWPCMGDALYGIGKWTGLIVFFDSDQRLVPFPDLPHRDPWGCRFLLELGGDSFMVRSSGPDRRLNTDDDIIGEGIIARPSDQARDTSVDAKEPG